MRGKLILAGAVVLLTAAAHGQMTRQELAGRMETETRQLAAAGVEYGEAWTPPGQGKAWAMDCSNTARWLYASTLGKSLPRTASAQYETLRAEGRLKRGLHGVKPGDLLFWENTYRPSRKPPITHVMVFLGKDAGGRMWMAGSQGSRGVDVYAFDPSKPMGGYNWFLWFKKKGKFVGYGRPA
jgi:cell wall-associated NlpC family hydrolase